MKGLSIMSVIGSAVPARIRDLGLLACWYVVRDGEIVSKPLLCREDARALCEHLEGVLLA
ncbi:hypothetical protein [Pseudomonas typographi]|uniref:hypothetical protein n=1 Tax=Pseudomonas typographi TaxID=2715964 RepID=UPI001683CC18|nr:hypothetical protein [Pseudomonas typographi]MBD1553570.1 hypothetical protein [Pseudomonas typographi]